MNLIRLPKISQQLSFPINVLAIDIFLEEILSYSEEDNLTLREKTAIQESTKEILVESIWQ